MPETNQAYKAKLSIINVVSEIREAFSLSHARLCACNAAGDIIFQF